MNTVMTLIIAFVVIVLHVWLCHRSPKFWYLEQPHKISTITGTSKPVTTVRRSNGSKRLV